ncbi:MAG: sigma-54-dependent Fis family transcriptional regulator [bacterium]|nr:sigma-54-dependent Fis family transcriptional regulator [bacterium]
MTRSGNSCAPWLPGELRVMVVDDEPDVRLGLRLLAESVQAEVREAESGEQAVEICESWMPHLVLSDITMDGMSGVELLSVLGRKLPEVRVVLITGFGTIELAVEAMRRGAVHFITKPFDNEEVLQTVLRYGQEAVIREKARGLESSSADGTPRIIGEDPKMQAVLDLVRTVAPTPMSVLIQGESGSGKELVARSIHAQSEKHEAPFLAVNSAALPDTLLESELFGHQKGAFTGADRTRAGIFARAEDGTVFLDEIALMSPAFQGKLLRVLQERTVVPLGTTTSVPVDFRLVAATSRDLTGRIDAGEFREDLFYRLRVVTIDVPPLRERPDDIVPLATHFLSKYSDQVAAHVDRPPYLSPAAISELRGHAWKGNVRELENCVQRALVLARGEEILPAHLGLGNDDGAWAAPAVEALTYEAGKQEALQSFQRSYIERALVNTGGNVTRAAEKCGLTRAALQRIMRSLDLDRNKYVSPGEAAR